MPKMTHKNVIVCTVHKWNTMFQIV